MSSLIKNNGLVETSDRWHVLKSYPLGGTEHELFLDQLEEDLGWDSLTCLRTILEYKKFLYLNCITTKTVVPSDKVSEIWQQHFSFEADYQEAVCTRILNQEIDNTPSMQRQLSIQYLKNEYWHTLYLYEKTFEVAPPTDIWPIPDKNKNIN